MIMESWGTWQNVALGHHSGRNGPALKGSPFFFQVQLLILLQPKMTKNTSVCDHKHSLGLSEEEEEEEEEKSTSYDKVCILTLRNSTFMIYTLLYKTEQSACRANSTFSPKSALISPV